MRPGSLLVGRSQQQSPTPIRGTSARVRPFSATSRPARRSQRPLNLRRSRRRSSAATRTRQARKRPDRSSLLLSVAEKANASADEPKQKRRKIVSPRIEAIKADAGADEEKDGGGIKRIYDSGSEDDEKKKDSFSKGALDELTCGICLELIYKAVSLPCEHAMCDLCLRTWMKQRQTCPQCREPFEIPDVVPSRILDNLADKLVRCLDTAARRVRDDKRKSWEQWRAHMKSAAIRGPSVADALKYLDMIKVAFSHEPHVYNDFLQIMRDFKLNRLDSEGVVWRVKVLFERRPHLVLGFNQFLPVGFKVTDPRPPTEYSNAVSYVAKIKERFMDRPEVYADFLCILHEYQNSVRGRGAVDVVKRRIQVLFEGHDDLLEEFQYFTPDH